MSYVDKNLIPGESVVYRGSLSRLPYGWAFGAIALAVVSAVFRNFFPVGHRWLVPGLLIGIAVVLWLWAWMRVASAEFAVTNRRVMIKLGVLQRRTVETMLSKIEAVAVDQGLSGRIFDFGTITVTGTGGTRETFENIASPLEFRRQVQGQLARIEDDHSMASRAAQLAALPQVPPR
jgi:uncharacterized membrane protein YdbT with pleckstrin-like domain